MTVTIVWLVHTPAGAVGLVSAAVALFTNKGSALHRSAGICFTVSMLIMLAAGFVAAWMKESPGDLLLSAGVMYTVFTAWLTAHRRNGETGFLEKVGLAWIVAFALVAFFLGENDFETSTASVYTYWAVFAVICAIGDIRNLRRDGLPGVQRMIRHVWRIGFTLVWTALSLTDKIIKSQGYDIKEMAVDQVLYIVGVPTGLVLTITVYWLVNIIFFSHKKFSRFDG